MSRTVQMTLDSHADSMRQLQLFERSARSQGWSESDIAAVRQRVTQSNNPMQTLYEYIDDPDANLLLG